jgi:hypothetical protein
MKTVTRWTPHEIKLVRARIVEEVRADKTLELLTAVRRAVDATLPLDRRRPKPSLSLYGRASNVMFHEAHQEGLRLPPIERPKSVPLPHAPSADAPPGPAPAGETPTGLATDGQTEGPFPTPQNLDPMLGFVPTCSLFGELAYRFIRDLTERLDRIEAAAVARIAPALPIPHTRADAHPPVTHEPSRHHREKPQQQRVAIIGLFKDQFAHVVAKASEVPFRLIFVDKEDAHYRIPPCDFVIVQRHSAHAWFEKARATLGPDRVVFVDGGISGVVQRLFDFHARSVAAAAHGRSF